MKEVYFNDCTATCNAANFYRAFTQLMQLWVQLKSIVEVTKIRCVDESFFARVFSPAILRDRELLQFAQKIIQRAYVGEKRSSFVTEINGQDVLCEALGRSAKSGMVALGMDSGAPWNRIGFVVREISEDSTSKKYDALQFTRQDQLASPEFANWAEKTFYGEIETCSIPASLKRRHFKKDHGIDVLDDFANQLLNSPYILSIINSLPFKRKACNFVEYITDKGIINLRLHWTDAGYGMAIQTTGRNLAQTRKIAELLKRYDRRT